jgi:hypothetical protein
MKKNLRKGSDSDARKLANIRTVKVETPFLFHLVG